MRVLAVAQAYKETLSLDAVADALGAGVRAAGADPAILRASDGGDGLLEAVRPFFQGRSSHRVSGPMGGSVAVEAGWLNPTTALIESRLVCGLSLVPPARRDPSRATSRGLGELVAQLEEQGAQDVYVGLGGSATMDGGIGMARSWGWAPLDAHGETLLDGGGSLAALASLRAGRRLRVRLIGLVDVRNPLNGARGARVFAAQKGATPGDEERLSAGLERLTIVTRAAELASTPGAGAAGGLGFGILFFGGGSLLPGAAWVLERVGFGLALREADLVLCGEGCFDQTSLEGKLTGTVLAAARASGIPAGLLAPRASDVPAGVLLETLGGLWSAEDLAHRAERVVRRALRAAHDV
jgi:glycerate kinase